MRELFIVLQFLIGITSCFFTFPAMAQQKPFHCQIRVVDTISQKEKELLLLPDFPNKTACFDYIQKLPLSLSLKGYISASVDSIAEKNDTVFAWVFMGQMFKWDKIHVVSDDKIWIQENVIQLNALNDRIYSTEKIESLRQSFLDYCSNNGFPFASTQLDSLAFDGNRVSGNLVLKKNNIYFIDSIAIVGDARLKQNFIHQYLSIGSREPYSTDKLKQIDILLRELPYVEQSQPWTITMASTGAMITLYLKQKQSSQIDAIIGFLPENGDLGGKLLVTGQVNVNLQNAFNGGEAVGINWQQLQSKSPRLVLNFGKPYLFHSPYGLNIDFELYKKDSSYLNVNAKTGIQYHISGRQSGIFYVQFASTRLLDVDTLSIISSKKLPAMIDISSTSLGMTYNINTTDYRFNPRRGNELDFSMAAGSKRIIKNATITNIRDTFDYNQLYDTVPLKSYLLRSVASFNAYLPVGRQAVFKTGVSAGIFYSPRIYVNEMFQIGGRRLLRGFDEESIFANQYVVATEEYRYLIGQNAYFFAFADGGWAQYRSQQLRYNHTYIGLGGGISFQTKNGLLNVSYAVGKRNDTKLDMQQAKIHIGFTSFF